MRNTIAAIVIAMLAATFSVVAKANDAETIAAVNAAADALDKAFEQQDAKAIDSLTTDDHIAVTPYYGAPTTIAEQTKSLAELKYDQTNLDAPKVTLLGQDAAIRSFRAELKGTYKGKPIPSPVFVTSIMVKTDNGWQEKFYQVTKLAGGRSGFGACMGLAGTYLTKNSAKGAGSLSSRSLISFSRGGQISFTDSGAAGETGYAPFSGGRGAWQCTADEEKVKARATVLDFTFPKEGGAQIGRLDLDILFDATSKAISGTATLYLVPLGADPLKRDALGGGRQFEIAGERVEVP